MFEFEFNIGSAEDKRDIEKRLSHFKKVIDCFSDIVDRMSLRADDKGIYIQVMDSMHVAMIDVFFSCDIFSSFRCDREVYITVPLKQFIAVLKALVPESSSRILFLCDDSPQNLKVVYNSNDMNHEWNINLYSDKAENYDVPEFDYTCTINMPIIRFKNVMKHVGGFGEYINLRCEKDTLCLKQSGECINTKSEIKNNGTDILIESVDPAEHEIAMKYVNLVNKFAPDDPDKPIQIQFSSNTPVYYRLNIFDTLGFTKLYVAPKSTD